MAGPNYNSPGRFPGPFLNDCKKDESVMEYVPTDTLDIGARKSGMPPATGENSMSGDPARSMNIAHVGNSSTGKA